MSLQNLIEDFLYDLLPEGIIDLDEQGLIQAVVGGYQDRVDDLRAYTSKMELLVTSVGLPETDNNGTPVNNAVICQVQSPQGKIYNRSLEFQADTPANASDELITWAAAQLQLDEDHVLVSAAYGVDALRLVDANVMAYLAGTVGAVLYQTAAMNPDNAQSDARRLLLTWFPRLQFKGTAQSFETLGRLLGFDDIRMMPLWGRLSPRIANDIGDPDNNQDFATTPDYFPKQVRDNFYDPWNLNDGPFYTWTGTATARLGESDTNFYTQIINGFNPFITVSVVGTAPVDPDPTGSPYILIGGGPEKEASVTPPGSGLMFKAISAGSSFNGLEISFTSADNGTMRIMSITDRLSAIKYRTSFFDLGMTMDFDHALAQFGTEVARANKDLINDPTSANFGETALSPFRPWMSGSLVQELISEDWLVRTNPTGDLTVAEARTQADLTSRQYDQDALSAAGAQVVSAMEEVRPATRTPRQINTGYLIKDQVGYAKYCAKELLFETGEPEDILETTPESFAERFGFFTFGDIPGLTSLTFNTDIMDGGFDIENCNDLVTVSAPNLTDIDPGNTQNTGFFVFDCPNVTTVSLPLLETTSGDSQVQNCTAMTSLSIASLSDMGGGLYVVNAPLVTTLTLNNLSTLGRDFILDNVGLSSMPLPSLTAVGQVVQVINCVSITSFSAAALVTAILGLNFQDDAALTTVSFSSFVPTNGTTINFINCALNVTSVNHILARCVANAGYVSGVVNLSGGTSATPTGQGATDVTTLQGRGVTVFTN